MRSALIPVADRLDSLATRIKRRADRRNLVDRVSLAELERRGWSGVQPVFVLSTGRCGTKLLTELLEAAGGAAVHHAPRPELVRVSRRAFEEIDERLDMFVEVVKTAREELVWESVRYGRAYVETNNRVTFLAPALAEAFPEARFMHLVRHPADIVRSGIRRGWYGGGHAHELARIKPLDPAEAADFETRDPISKIGWMWQQTNAFIERFVEQLPAGRTHFVTAERLFGDADAAAEAVRFCGVEPPPASQVEAMIARPVNAQRSGDFPAFADWTPEQRQLLRDAAPLAARYGYEL